MEILRWWEVRATISGERCGCSAVWGLHGANKATRSLLRTLLATWVGLWRCQPMDTRSSRVRRMTAGVELPASLQKQTVFGRNKTGWSDHRQRRLLESQAAQWHCPRTEILL